MTSAAALATAVVMLVGSPASAATTSASNAATGGLRASSEARSQALAGSISFRVFNTACTATAVKFSATTSETGFSGVQRFKQRAVLQEFTSLGWLIRDSRTISSVKFPNDGRNFSFTLNWTGTHVNNGASWREVWQGIYLNGAGAVIAKTRKVAVTCL